MAGHVLIAGCGYVGAALAEQLLRGGTKVSAIRRDPRALPYGVIPIAADLGDARALDGLSADIDRLVYAAAPDGSERAQYQAAYVAGLANVVAALERAGARPRRAVLTSSTSVYAEDDGSWVDEESAVLADGNAQTLLESEALVRSSFEDGIALRLGGIYGPGRDRMVRSVADGTARLPRAPRYANRIHRDDAASAIAALLEAPVVAGTYVGVDDDPAELGVLFRWIADALGMPPPPLEDEAARGGRGGHKRCRNARLRGVGWAPAYPSFREGYRAAIEARLGAG